MLAALPWQSSRPQRLHFRGLRLRLSGPRLFCFFATGASNADVPMLLPPTRSVGGTAVVAGGFGSGGCCRMVNAAIPSPAPFPTAILPDTSESLSSFSFPAPQHPVRVGCAAMSRSTFGDTQAAWGTPRRRQRACISRSPSGRCRCCRPEREPAW